MKALRTRLEARIEDLGVVKINPMTTYSLLAMGRFNSSRIFTRLPDERSLRRTLLASRHRVGASQLEPSRLEVQHSASQQSRIAELQCDVP